MHGAFDAAISFWNAAGVAFWRYALALLLQTGALVIFLIALDFLILRRRVRAVVRYWVWLLVLVKLILPPTISLPTGAAYWFAGSWSSDVTNSPSAPTVAPSVASAEPTAHSSSALPPPMRESHQPFPIEDPPSRFQENHRASAQTSLPPSAVIPIIERHRVSIAWQAWLLAGWLLGVFGLSAFVLHRIVLAYRLVERATSPDQRLLAVFNECKRSMGIHRRIGVGMTDELSSPAVCGILRPFVLLPPTIVKNLDETQWRAVFAHELAHVARGDLAVQAVQTLLQVLHFYNPFVWLANALIRRTREQAVDENVLVILGRDPSDYSGTLIEVAEMAVRRPALGLGLIGVVESRSALAERIRHILSRPVPRSARLGLAGAIAVLVLAATTLPMAGAPRQRAAGHAETKSVNASPSSQAQPSASSQPTHVSLTAASKPAEPESSATGVLSGRFTDDKGQPVTDARIQLDNGKDYQHAKTDANGFYRFDTVKAPGLYSMWIQSKGWIGTQFHQDRPQVQLTPDGHIVKNLTLQRACKIRMQVTDEQGQPVRRARLSISSLGSELALNSAEGIYTGKDGTGVIGGIPASETAYLATIVHDQFAPNRVTVTLKDPEKILTEMVILSKGVDVPGRAICADGNPAAGWSIIVQPSWWHGTTVAPQYKIAMDGSFTLKRIVPGTYSYFISIPEANSRFSRSETAGQGSLPLAGNALLEIRLSQQSPAAQTEISGTVRFTGGKPREYFDITAMSAKRDFYTTRVAPTEKLFKVGPMPAGEYELRFESTEFESKVLKDVKAPKNDLQVEIPYSGRPVIRGRVVDAATGKPLESFKTRLRKLRTLRGPNYVGDINWHDSSGTDGRFEIDTVGPGIYEVQVTAEGFAQTVSRSINTDIDRDLQVQIELKPGMKLIGEVIDEAGRPVAGAKVISASIAGGTTGSMLRRFVSQEGAVFTDPNGRFALTNVTPGHESLKVIHPDYAPALIEEIDVKEGVMPTAVKAMLKSGGTVVGQVFNSEGTPEPNVSLYVQDDYAYQGGGDDVAGRLAVVTTDDQGRYEVRHLPEQLCFIRRNVNAIIPGVMRQTVLPANEQKQTINLGGGPRLTGRLIIDGKPFANGTVELGGASPHFGTFTAYAVTDGTGAFSFRGAPPGRWHLYWTDPGQQRDWFEVREIEVRDTDQDIGTVSPPTATVTVTVNGGAPLDSQLHLMTYSRTRFWGKLIPDTQRRQGPTDPFVFKRIAPGDYELTFSPGSSSMKNVRRRITLASDQQNLSLAMDMPSGEAAIEVHLSSELLDKPGFLTAMFVNRDLGLSAYIDSSKQICRIEHLPAGTYDLTDALERGAKSNAQLELKAGETKVFELDPQTYGLSPNAKGGPGRLRIGIVSPEGRPLPGTQAYLTGPQGRIEPDQTTDLSTEFLGREGEYVLHVIYPGIGQATTKVSLESVNRAIGFPMAPSLVLVRLQPEAR